MLKWKKQYLCGVKNYSDGAERCERGKYFRGVFINIVWTNCNVIMRVRLLCYKYVSRKNKIVVTSIRDNDRRLSVNGK